MCDEGGGSVADVACGIVLLVQALDEDIFTLPSPPPPIPIVRRSPH